MTDEIAIGHLQKRKIEARVLIPFVTACREKFGDGPTQRGDRRDGPLACRRRRRDMGRELR